jgi:hypothetical protein
MILKIEVAEGGKGVSPGTYQVLIVPGGLKLVRSGKLPIDIPVGSRAHGYPGATLHIVTDRVECDVKILGFAFARQRLAEGLALFLTKRGPAPNVADYREPYLLVLEALPFVLAALPFGAMFLARGLLWGGVAGSLLFAGGVFIAKRHDLPVGARIAALSLVNVLAYGIVIALMLAKWPGNMHPNVAGNSPPANAAGQGPSASTSETSRLPRPPVFWSVPVESPVQPQFPPVVFSSRSSALFEYWQHLRGSPGEFLAQENRALVRGQFDVTTGEIGVVSKLSTLGRKLLPWPPADVDSQGRLAVVAQRTTLVTKRDKPYPAKPGVVAPAPSVSQEQQTIYVIFVWAKDRPLEPLCSIEFTSHIPWIGWDANGRLIVLAGNTLTAWDVVTSKSVFEFPGKYAFAAALGPSRRWLVAAGEKGQIEVLDASSGKSLGQPYSQGRYRWLSISADGQHLAGISQDDLQRMDNVHLHVWELAAGKMLYNVEIPLPPTNISGLICVGSDFVVLPDIDHAFLVDLKSQSLAGRFDAEFPVRYSPDGRMWWAKSYRTAVFYSAGFRVPGPTPGDLGPGTKVAVGVQTGDPARDRQVSAVLKTLLEKHRYAIGDGGWKLQADAGMKDDSGYVALPDHRSYAMPFVAGKIRFLSPSGQQIFSNEPSMAFSQLKSRYFVRRTNLKFNKYKDEFDFKGRDPRIAMEDEVWEHFVGKLAGLQLPTKARFDGEHHTFTTPEIPLDYPAELGQVLKRLAE